jgi:hypothetical protein
MANQKVTQLPAANTSNDADLLYVVQGTTSRKTTKQLLMASTLAVANAAASTANAATVTANAAANTANNALSQVGTAVQKTGDTMTGDLDMGNNQIENLGTPFAPADATTKTYVDAADALKLDLSGGTMTGDIDMGGQMVNNLGTPVANDDAATKGYVDTALGGKQNTVATTTGVAVALVTPQEYGSYGTPETGNIGVSLTNAVRGIDQIVYHDDTVAPTIVVAGGTAVKFGTAGYDLTKVNVIVFWFMGGTNVGYIITPAV